MDERGLLLDQDNDLLIRGGTFAIGITYTQEVALLLLSNKGEWRHDPLAGCDLVRRINGRISRPELERILKVQVERDGKSFNEMKDALNIRSHG